MHEKLWAGPELKLQYAQFHFDMMSWSIQQPEPTSYNVALQSSGAIIDRGWRRKLYAYLDAFLSTARSVPEIIQCCFGVDLGHPDMEKWFKTLPADERDRRKKFKEEFKQHYEDFSALPLSTTRNISFHRGVVSVTVKVSGLFGVTYTGNPVDHIPLSEARQIDDPNRAFLAKQNPIQPTENDFKIDGEPLFPECREYLEKARALIEEGRRIAREIHDNKSLSAPPT
jgi:hypothetical protein